MEGLMMRKQIICDENTAPSSSSSSVSTSIHKNSHTKSKVKAKIRIIHIFSPEIIKTDAANFRELVQRLTGKPTAAADHNCSKRVKIKREKLTDHHALREEEEEEEEEEMIWRDANTGGGFLGGFPELDHFPFMEGTTTNKDACV